MPRNPHDSTESTEAPEAGSAGPTPFEPARVGPAFPAPAPEPAREPGMGGSQEPHPAPVTPMTSALDPGEAGPQSWTPPAYSPPPRPRRGIGVGILLVILAVA